MPGRLDSHFAQPSRHAHEKPRRSIRRGKGWKEASRSWLSLTMANLRPHTTLLAAHLASSFSCLLRSHFGLLRMNSTSEQYANPAQLDRLADGIGCWQGRRQASSSRFRDVLLDSRQAGGHVEPLEMQSTGCSCVPPIRCTAGLCTEGFRVRFLVQHSHHAASRLLSMIVSMQHQPTGN